MSDEGELEEPELTDEEKKNIAKWFLINAPSGEIQYVAQDLRSILRNEDLYAAAALEAFPVYNKTHLLAFEMPDKRGEVIISKSAEIDKDHYLNPRTAQVVTVDHVKQVCTRLRSATDEELPSPYIEEYRGALDTEICKYVSDTYAKGACSVCCTMRKDAEGPGSCFELAVVISACRYSPKNFCNGSWCSTWNIEFNDDVQAVQLKGKVQVGAHYFEEGNVQLETNNEFSDSATLQNPEDTAASIASMIRHHETEIFTTLEASYLKLPDTTFKDLRRKLPITRTLFPWNNTTHFSLSKEICKDSRFGRSSKF